jgi:asparagine N-glycosylation enzyme membrane subunit Stt3
MRKRVERNAMLGRYGVQYSWVYWAAIVAMFAFLIVDIFDDGAIWNYAVIVCIIIAIAVRPGGFWGPRGATAGKEDASRDA